MRSQTSLQQVADSSPISPARSAHAERRPHRQRQARREATGSSASTTASPRRSIPRATSCAAERRFITSNHSPDALPYLWLFVEQNLCAPNSITNQLNQPPLVFLGSSFDFSCQGFAGGGHMESLKIGGVDAKRTRLRHDDAGRSRAPLASGASIDIDCASGTSTFPRRAAAAWATTAPLYEMAQWYPRMCVYDDVRGWNHEPYIGAGEFYLEYGNFDVSLTVPRDYIVAATGELANPDAGAHRDAAQAARARATVRHGDRDHRRKGGRQRSRRGRDSRRRPGHRRAAFTWHFTATNVRDFAFAAGPNLRWDASGYDGILIETLYRPTADKWPEVNAMAREAIKYFSEQWYPLSVVARDDRRGPDRRDGVPDAHVHAEQSRRAKISSG